MTAAEIVQKILAESPDVAALIEPELIYTLNLPESLKDKTGENVLLITEVSNPFTEFASDRSHARRPLVQLQVWFKDDADADEIQQVINETLEKNDWYCSNDAGLDVDPDTKELYWTVQYSKTIYKDVT